MSRWLVYYKYTNMEGHTIEDNEIISLWEKELDLDIILKKLNARSTTTVIMNMVRLK